jgi:hypothetical protein
MNSKSIGLILLVIGALMIIYTGFHYITTEKIAEIGPIEINKDKNHFVSWSPILGVVLFGAGLLMTFLKSEKA